MNSSLLFSNSFNISPPSRPRSNSYTSSVKELHIGTKVLIIETENVVQRARHLIGKIGTICEVPVHPATWFKVEFPDYPVTTFRPSAFRIIPSDQDMLDAFDLPSNPSYQYVPKPKPSPSNRVKKIKLTSSSSSSSSSHPNMKPKSLFARSSYDHNHPMSYMNQNGIDDDDAIPDNDSVSTSTGTAGGQGEESSSVSGGLFGSSSLSSSSGSNDPSKQKPLILDNLDPDVWVGCGVKIIAGKNHMEEGKVARTGNGWVQVITLGNEEVAKRAHELEVISLPPGVSRPIHSNRSTSVTSGRRKVTSSSNGNNNLNNSSNYYQTSGYDDSNNNNNNNNDRPRPRRLMKKFGEGDGNRNGIAMNSNEMNDDQDDNSIRDYHYWMKQLKKSIHIDENYSCHRGYRPTSLSIGSSSSIGSTATSTSSSLLDHNDICSHCYSEKWPGSKLCWNSECSYSPSYDEYADRINSNLKRCFPIQELFPATTTSSSSPSNEATLDSIIVPSHGDKSANRIGYTIISAAAKKHRSDSAITDKESPSPELTSKRYDFHDMMLLPSNATFIKTTPYDEHNEMMSNDMKNSSSFLLPPIPSPSNRIMTPSSRNNSNNSFGYNESTNGSGSGNGNGIAFGNDYGSNGMPDDTQILASMYTATAGYPIQ